MAEERKQLTLKQRLFVQFYTGKCRGNATAAALEAGYSGNDATIRSSASQVLTNIHVREEINRILTERTITGPQVLDRLTEHANGSLTHFLKVDGDLVHMDLSTEDAQANLHLLKKVKTRRRTSGTMQNPVETIETEIELHDPQAALVQLGRFHGIFTDRTPSGVSVSTPGADGRSTVTVTGATVSEVQMLALHNDLLAAALISAGVDVPEDLRPPNMLPPAPESANSGAPELQEEEEDGSI